MKNQGYELRPSCNSLLQLRNPKLGDFSSTGHHFGGQADCKLPSSSTSTYDTLCFRVLPPTLATQIPSSLPPTTTFEFFQPPLRFGQYIVFQTVKVYSHYGRKLQHCFSLIILSTVNPLTVSSLITDY